MTCHSFLRRGVKLLFVALIATCLSACTLGQINTPSEMVELQDSRRHYAAMTHDGVVLRSQIIAQGPARAVPRGEQDFWVKSVRERMRTSGGYALLEEKSIESANGQEGTLMKFGRDQDGASYHYWVALYVTHRNIHILDVGGRADRFEAIEDALLTALTDYEVRR